jgi:hypothetical protein
MTPRELDEAQRNMETWMKVGMLVDQALKLLQDANLAPVEQAMLMHLSDKAPVQVQLWNV